jgi:hypothetical protein
MCPQTPRLSPEYSHKAGLQTVITEAPLQIRPVTRSGHVGPDVVWSEGCPRPLSCLRWTGDHGEGLERRVASSPSPQHSARPRPSLRQEATLAMSPCRPTISPEHLMQRCLTPYPDAHPSVDKAEVTAVTSSLH